MKMKACAIVGSGVADVERAGDHSSGTSSGSLNDAVVGRERADAERVEEVRDEADGELQERRLRQASPALAPLARERWPARGP